MSKPRIYQVKSNFKKKRQRSRYVPLFLVLALTASLAFLCYAIFSSNLLVLTTLKINPEDSKYTQNIQNFISSKNILDNKNAFLFDYEGLREDLRINFPKLKFHQVERSGLGSIIINYERKTPLIKYCLAKSIGSECIYFDDFAEEIEVDESSKNDFVIFIEDERTEGSIAEVIETIRSIDDDIKELQIAPASYLIPSNGLPSIHIYTKLGPTIFLSFDDISNQLKILKKALENRLDKATLVKLKYVDLRIKDRIYYK